MNSSRKNRVSASHELLMLTRRPVDVLLAKHAARIDDQLMGFACAAAFTESIILPRLLYSVEVNLACGE